jgi:DNA end-binding protein Ku
VAAAEEEVVSTPGMRSFWTGTITFGLVSVPINLFPATVRRRVSFRMVGAEGTPVQRLYVCSKDEKELDQDDIVRGFEIDKGKFVIVDDEELEAIAPRKSREIDLRVFVDRDSIDPMYFGRGYFLTPSGGSNKAYRLLAEVMERSGKAGLATFVMRAKEYLVAIMAEKGVLRAETLRFKDEIRTADQVGLPAVTKPKPAEVTKFERLITKESGKLNLSIMVDDYARRVEKLVAKKQKQRGAEIVKMKPAEAASTEEEGGNVVDILEALRKSMATASKGASKAKRAPAKKAPARKAAAPRKKAAAAKRK